MTIMMMMMLMIVYSIGHHILQQLRFCNPLATHHIEKDRTPTDMNFNSKPCMGNSDNPPTAPSITASGAVQAGQPGVNAAKAPPSIVDESDFTDLIIFILLILKATMAKLIPASADIATVSMIVVVMYAGTNSAATSKWTCSIDIVRK